MFIAAVGKEAELVRRLLARAISDGMETPADAAMARRILEGAQTNGIVDSQITDNACFTLTKCGAGRLERYIAECGTHG